MRLFPSISSCNPATHVAGFLPAGFVSGGSSAGCDLFAFTGESAPTIPTPAWGRAWHSRTWVWNQGGPVRFL